MKSAKDSDWYMLNNTDQLDSPALMVYKDRVIHNIHLLKSMIDDFERLRPHVKTHKSEDVTLLLMEAGIRKFKCATIAEAEMLGISKAKDVLLAYQPTQTKVRRLIKLIKKYPKTTFCCLVDNLRSATFIAAEATASGVKITIFIDLNVGMNRTGIIPDEQAVDLYHELSKLNGIKIAGLHAYDGHIYENEITTRHRIWSEAFAPVEILMSQLTAIDNTLKLVAGGTPTFPFNARAKERECSPGTFIFWDKGYGDSFQEQQFLPAAVVITRVVSVPSKNLACIDLGYKSIASENVPDRRVYFLNCPEAKLVSHSEEHMVISVPEEYPLQTGDILYALPVHICPTVALYPNASVVENGVITSSWKITARDRVITL